MLKIRLTAAGGSLAAKGGEQATVGLFRNSHSHRGFSPVDSRSLRMEGTVFNGFWQANKIAATETVKNGSGTLACSTSPG